MYLRGVASLVVVAAVAFPGAATPDGEDPPPDPDAVVSVAFNNGAVLIDVASGAPGSARPVNPQGTCVRFAYDGGEATRICATGRRWATVTAPSGRWRVPIQVNRRGPGVLRLRLRQADAMLPARTAAVTVQCAGICATARDRVVVPQLVMQSCRPRGPWLVHSATHDIGRAVALTFDDGPGPGTRKVLSILRRHSVPATFFQVGRMVQQDSALLRRIRREGHVLANHSFTHPVMTGRHEREVTATSRTIRRASGFDPCLFRAPYGENPASVVALARSQGLITVHWNVDPGDWRGLDASQMVRTSLQQTRPGSVLVFHDGTAHRQMLAGLPRLLSSLRERGYRFLTVPELLRLPVRYR